MKIFARRCALAAFALNNSTQGIHADRRAENTDLTLDQNLPRAYIQYI